MATMNNRVSPREEGIAGVDWVAVLIGGTIGVLIGGIFGLIGLLFKGVLMMFNSATTKDQELEEEKGSSADTTKVAEVTFKPKADRDLGALFSPAYDKQWDDSIIRTVDVASGKVRMVFYPHLGVVKRTLIIKSKAAEKRLGCKRMVLADLAVSSTKGLEAAVEQTKIDVRKITAVAKPDSANLHRPAKAASIKDQPVSETVQQPKAAAEGNPQDPVSGKEEPPPKKIDRAPEYKEVAYRGELLFHGFDWRGEDEKRYKSYCLDIHDENVGSKHRVWGADLERAVKDAGVAIGDRIEVAQTGKITTANKRKMNIFAIQQLNPARG